MRSYTSVLATAGAVASAAIAFSDPARACSVCQAGDPLFSAGGAAAQEQGTFFGYLEGQGWRKTSGLLPHHAGEEAEPGREVNESSALSLFLGWTPLDRLTVTLVTPWRFNEITEEPEGEIPETSRLNGFSDLSLHVGAVLWRNRDVLPSSWIELRGFGKAPTGKSHQSVDGVQDPHLQLGTGSWDFGFGLAAAHRLAWGSLYASAMYRENLEGSLDYRYGDVVLTNLVFEMPLSHFLADPVMGALTPGVELNFRYAEKDRYQGSDYESSGGSVLYLTPTLRVRLPWFSGQRPPFLRLAVQVPVTQSWLYGQQHEGSVWSAGLGMAY
ncbi:MAG TPA: hypothetical protein VII72_20980 [Myxococcota bacterium]